MERYDLSIIVLNYNGLEWLKKLLPSLKRNYLDRSNYKVEVVVVDNASTDLSIDYLKSIEWIRLIESGRNGGYAFGNNLALKDNQANYILLLNSDTEFTQESNLDVLVEYLDMNEKAAIVSPYVSLTSGKPDMACHRGEPTLWAAASYFAGLEKCFPSSRLFARYHQTYKGMKSIHQIDACTGAAMMVRTSAINQVGLLDEQFFMYAEDVDWCKRFRDAGFLVLFHPGVRIVHHKYKSGMANSNQSTKTNASYYFYQTMLQYYDKHYLHRYPRIARFILKQFIRYKQGTIQVLLKH